jgi:Lrp/AsnC family transcriptional regulator for asnA, asnC and gidA
MSADIERSELDQSEWAQAVAGRQQLDELDSRIIQALLSNARATNREIGKECGSTEVTVASRLRRLIENNIIKIFPVFDWRELGFQVEVHIYVEISKRSSIEVARIIHNLSGVLTTAVTFGASDIVVLAVAPSESELFHIIRQIEDIEGVAQIRVEPIEEVYVHRSSSIRLPASLTSPESFPASIGLDELDKGIIRLLQENGRLSSREIARRLTVHDAKIRSRIRRMEDRGQMALRAMIDPKQPGLSLLPSYLLRIVAIEDPHAIAERLSQLSSVIFVAVTRARWEVVAVTSQEEISEVSRIIEDTLWAHNDVRSVQTFVIATFYKAVPDLIRIMRSPIVD